MDFYTILELLQQEGRQLVTHVGGIRQSFGIIPSSVIFIPSKCEHEDEYHETMGFHITTVSNDKKEYFDFYMFPSAVYDDELGKMLLVPIAQPVGYKRKLIILFNIFVYFFELSQTIYLTLLLATISLFFVLYYIFALCFCLIYACVLTLYQLFSWNWVYHYVSDLTMSFYQRIKLLIEQGYAFLGSIEFKNEFDKLGSNLKASIKDMIEKIKLGYNKIKMKMNEKDICIDMINEEFGQKFEGECERQEEEEEEDISNSIKFEMLHYSKFYLFIDVKRGTLTENILNTKYTNQTIIVSNNKENEFDLTKYDNNDNEFELTQMAMQLYDSVCNVLSKKKDLISMDEITFFPFVLLFYGNNSNSQNCRLCIVCHLNVPKSKFKTKSIMHLLKNNFNYVGIYDAKKSKFSKYMNDVKSLFFTQKLNYKKNDKICLKSAIKLLRNQEKLADNVLGECDEPLPLNGECEHEFDEKQKNDENENKQESGDLDCGCNGIEPMMEEPPPIAMSAMEEENKDEREMIIEQAKDWAVCEISGNFADIQPGTNNNEIICDNDSDDSSAESSSEEENIEIRNTREYLSFINQGYQCFWQIPKSKQNGNTNNDNSHSQYIACLCLKTHKFDALLNQFVQIGKSFDSNIKYFEIREWTPHLSWDKGYCKRKGYIFKCFDFKQAITLYDQFETKCLNSIDKGGVKHIYHGSEASVDFVENYFGNEYFNYYENNHNRIHKKDKKKYHSAVGPGNPNTVSNDLTREMLEPLKQLPGFKPLCQLTGANLECHDNDNISIKAEMNENDSNNKWDLESNVSEMTNATLLSNLFHPINIKNLRKQNVKNETWKDDTTSQGVHTVDLSKYNVGDIIKIRKNNEIGIITSFSDYEIRYFDKKGKILLTDCKKCKILLKYNQITLDCQTWTNIYHFSRTQCRYMESMLCSRVEQEVSQQSVIGEKSVVDDNDD